LFKLLDLIKKKMPRGGKRKGSGRKMIYGEETRPVVTKVPKSKVIQFKKEVKEKVLNKWVKKKNK
jgi:hypothetical protein